MTIPKEVLDKINEKYPTTDFVEVENLRGALRSSAMWGYGLVEQRIKELEASDKWISVKDGLPEELVDVLVCMKRLNSDNYYFIVADYYEGQWNAGDREDLDNNPDFYVVTHYQYLPKPPKDI